MNPNPNPKPLRRALPLPAPFQKVSAPRGADMNAFVVDPLDWDWSDAEDARLGAKHDDDADEEQWADVDVEDS